MLSKLFFPTIFLVSQSFRYVLKRGDEELCHEELKSLFSTFEEFEGIQMFVSLVTEQPFPHLDKLLAYFRKLKGFVRVIE